MKFDVFASGWRTTSEVEITAYGSERLFLEVSGHKLEVYQDKSGFHFKCTCTHASVQSINSPSCSHACAVIIYLSKRYGEKK